MLWNGRDGGCREPALLLVAWRGRGYSVFGACIDFIIILYNYEFYLLKTLQKLVERRQEREGTHRSCCVEAAKRVSSRVTALNGPNVANTWYMKTILILLSSLFIIINSKLSWFSYWIYLRWSFGLTENTPRRFRETNPDVQIRILVLQAQIQVLWHFSIILDILKCWMDDHNM